MVSGFVKEVVIWKRSGGRVNDLFVELWDIDQIISFNELYGDVICGQYLFIASSDEGYGSYAYQK